MLCYLVFFSRMKIPTCMVQSCSSSTAAVDEQWEQHWSQLTPVHGMWPHAKLQAAMTCGHMVVKSPWLQWPVAAGERQSHLRKRHMDGHHACARCFLGTQSANNRNTFASAFVNVRAADTRYRAGLGEAPTLRSSLLTAHPSPPCSFWGP